MTKVTLLRHLGVALLPLALLGCEQMGPSDRAAYPVGSEEQMITTDAPNYIPGSVVNMRLTNTTSRVLGYNLCRAALERRDDGDWGPVQPTLAEACTAELRVLLPGRSVAYSFRLEPRLKRGSYRVRAELHDDAARTRVSATSAAFGVGRDRSD